MDGGVALPTLGEAVVSAVAASGFSVVVSTWTSFPTLAGTGAATESAAGGSAVAKSTAASASATDGSSETQNGGGAIGGARVGVGVLVLNVVVVALL